MKQSLVMQNEVISMLKLAGAVITDDHFIYTSGKHGSVYINKDALYPHTKLTSRIGELFAETNKSFPIDVVVGPAIGGIILSQWTAFHLSRQRNSEILGVYTEKDAENNQIFSRRGYDKFMPGKNILIVEDLTTTGGSIKKVVKSVRNAGGNIVSVCVMVNRDPHKVNADTIDAPFSSLTVLKAEAWDENACVLCKNNKPINQRIGHGKKYLEQKSNG